MLDNGVHNVRRSNVNLQSYSNRLNKHCVEFRLSFVFSSKLHYRVSVLSMFCSPANGEGIKMFPAADVTFVSVALSMILLNVTICRKLHPIFAYVRPDMTPENHQ